MKRLLLFLVIIPVFFGCNKVSPSINSVEKDSQTISIIYSGLTPYDNYF